MQSHLSFCELQQRKITGNNARQKTVLALPWGGVSQGYQLPWGGVQAHAFLPWGLKPPSLPRFLLTGTLFYLFHDIDTYEYEPVCHLIISTIESDYSCQKNQKAKSAI